MKRTRKTDGSNKVDLIFYFNNIKQQYISILKENLLPLQKEEKASPLPHIGQKEVEDSKGKQNIDLRSGLPRDPQAV